MKFSLKWIRELTPFTGSADELAERLTMTGVEVEGIRVQGGGLEKILVAEILASEKHPNADRLSVCEVETGSGKKRIVCGAANYKVGDKVPLALPGVQLPNGMEIKRSKIRGVESDGMMCSPKELGLAEDAQGLLILPAASKAGEPLVRTLGLDDTILDLEITPNRPDLLSHWGLTREIAAFADLPPPDSCKLLTKENPFAQQVLGSQSSILNPQSSPPFSVRVEDPAGCPRYTARIIRGVKAGPSPDWLRQRLESLGQRSISNIVDITNYVLLEIGQPLHAFDLKRLEGPEIIVRRARAGEKIVRLDEVTSELRPDMLVIADARRPVALAGVIGGKETAVTSSTTDILLESATFQPATIRKTSKALGVSTDSSYRFERGVDVELAAWASQRATALILQICGGQMDGPLVDLRAHPPSARKIRCRHPRVESLLGVSIPAETTNAILKRLGCRVNPSDHPSSCEVEPPSWRPDLERETDLIEEIGRLYGIEKIPGRMAPAAFSTTHDSDLFLFGRKVRALGIAQGLDEAQTYTVIASSDPPQTHAETGADPLILANPLSTKMNALRGSLLNELLHAAARSHGSGQSGIALFELGKIFSATNGKVEERLVLGILLTGTKSGNASWECGEEKKEPEKREAAYDFFDLKGMVEHFIGVSTVQQTVQRPAGAAEAPELEPGFGFLILLDDRVLGRIGGVGRRMTQGLKLPGDVFYAQLDGERLHQAQSRPAARYQPWPAYPSIRRDIALTVDASEKHQRIDQTLRRLARDHIRSQQISLQSVELFDIFQSDHLGAGKKSLAYMLIYQGIEKTLTDVEINEVHDRIKKGLKNEISCEIRE